jgi:hypothetical protein
MVSGIFKINNKKGVTSPQTRSTRWGDLLLVSSESASAAQPGGHSGQPARDVWRDVCVCVWGGGVAVTVPARTAARLPSVSRGPRCSDCDGQSTWGTWGVSRARSWRPELGKVARHRWGSGFGWRWRRSRRRWSSGVQQQLPVDPAAQVG